MDLKSVALRRLWERIRFTGVWPTLQYVLDMKIMEKLGIQINYVLEYIGEKAILDSDRTQEGTFSVITSIEEFSGQEIERLCVYGGDELVGRFSRRFSIGLRCLVARTQKGEMASLGWLMEAPRAFGNSGKPGSLIEDCFTLPEFRGKKIFQSLIRSGVQELQSCEKSESPRILMKCSVLNRSSLRGIMECGFCRLAIAYSFRHRVFIRPILAEKRSR